ncbi:MAG: FtsH protease activity modulator HflK [Alphaproteobacteria bacterium]|nr:FtsH protease activity modulator HflK [Alphaproteobacteria bacterium]
MPWENNSGGPWGSSGGGGNRGNGGGGPNSPWGRPGGGGGGRGPGGQPPDVEEMVRRGQEKLKSMMPGGLGGKGIVALILLVVLGWLATGFYRVEPQQRGAELVFGKLVATTEPGLNYNFPAPIGEVLLPNVTAINQVNIGFQNLSNGNKRVIDEESLMLTGDENIVAVQFSVFWKIKKAEDFLFNVRNPQESVRNAAEAAMREIVGKSGFEYIRTRGRNAVGLDAQKRIQEILDSYQAGIEITQVNPQSVEPPGEVIGAFRDVQAANADRERMINQATAYFNEVTQTAEGEAQRILRAAEAYKEERVNQAQGDSQRFLSILTEFEQAPDITKRRIYLQTMEEILERMNKVLIQNSGEGGGSGVLPYLPLDRLTNQQSQNRGASQ